MPRQRTNMISFRVSDEELRMIEKKMQLLGVKNKEGYLRKMAIDGYCVQLDLSEIRKMTTLLKRCSNNLNQYAKKANQTGSIYEEDIADLRTRLDEIYEKTACFLEVMAELK